MSKLKEFIQGAARRRPRISAGAFVGLSAALLPFYLAAVPAARGAEAVSPKQFLIEQIRLGEARYKDDLVRQSLYRLELIDPNNPEILAARIRLALRQGDQTLARQQLEKLKALAPDSPFYRQAEMNLALTRQEMRQKLQQARLLSTAGRYAEARAQYDELFHGEPPTIELAVEYWRLVARLPDQEPTAIDQLAALDRRYPGNVSLRVMLARLLFSQHRNEQAYGVLQQLATDPAGVGPASSLWLEIVGRMDVTPQSLESLKRYMTVFGEGNQAEAGRKMLNQQLAMLADPAYQARLSGLNKIGRGDSGGAVISELNKALAAAPNDPELIGAIGVAYLRAGDREKALSQFQLALKADVNRLNAEKWETLIKSTRYWQRLNEGDRALKANNLMLAQLKYNQARQWDSTDAFALIGLGDVAVAAKNDAAAETAYQQALRLAPNNASALRGLVNIHLRQSPESALAYINGLPRGQQNRLRETLNALQRDIIKQRADQFFERQQWAQAADQYSQARQLDPDDIWMAYRYALTLRRLGQTEQADSLLQGMAAQLPADAEKSYAYALYLSSTDRDAQALAYLNTLPAGQWNGNMRELAQRLTLQQALVQAQAMRDAGDERGAVAYLRGLPADPRIDLELGDWALARGEYDEALAAYQRVNAREPQNADARLGEVEAFIAQGRLDEARQRLRQPAAQADKTDNSLNDRRRIANAWLALGDTEQAETLFQRLRIDARQEAPGQNQALVYRDAARFERRRLRPLQAQQDYRQAMAASGIAPALPQDNDAYTRLTRNNPADNWLQRSVRAEAAETYRQQDINVTLDHDYWQSSGTPGISDLKAHDTMLQVDMPWHNGRAFFRTDTIRMNAGSFALNKDGVNDARFGACADLLCRGRSPQRATGTSVAAGWKNDRWEADVGTTPIGFEVVDIVGGVSYSNKWRNIGWTATASRRPISSSLLAFGGVKHPQTVNAKEDANHPGITWGGVRANGAALGLSYDRGQEHGVWSNFSAHQLSGKNVADNYRIRAMGGYYYKIVNQDNRRVTVGLNNMWMHYQKDLSGYSFGQGGYYSPQRYFSVGVPVNYRQRTENWSWELGGSVSWSRSSTKSQRRYPLSGALGSPDPVDPGGSSHGIGYTVQAAIERRLSSHWTLGVGVDIQQAKDYTPSHGMIYLRYSASGWQGDLDSPPQPLTPYADFK
ncbi:cellulose synthase complex outer membrane protein BcsC [Brenneria populi subsp. brevivirga]|uniref:cellulose synthase complex outer membrane protein BcsC n=1 Tax=Brenneria populi TaxID=1505588 RepID=UPI002E198F09|nr:cellulose synthase complex outer membrane protein BcsC [Brenneria populi subsp. brevivirga]